MVRPAALLALAATAALLRGATALDSDVYIYLSEGAPRCFIEELPEGTVVIGNYKHAETADKPAVVRVLDPADAEVYAEKAEAVGRFAYAAATSGQHQICIESDADAAAWPPRGTAKARFHLRLELHGSGQDRQGDVTADVAKKSHLSALEKEILALEEMIDLVLKDIDYVKQQEQHFRDQGERINSRVMWWSLFQTLVLLLSGIWQIWHLKNFFRRKKLV